MTTYDASTFDSTFLGSTATANSLIYQRDASLALNSTLADATDIGLLQTNTTQLDIKAQVSRENGTHFYKFTLDGDSIKATFTNNTNSSALRMQVLNSAGKVVADSSTTASQTLQDAYAKMTSSKGLSQKAGDYFMKVTFDATSLRSVAQTYSVGLYSGTKFDASYQTTGKSQTSTKQTVLLDNTMTYSLIDAQAYETKSSHAANETAASAVNIGWLYENKSALSVSSRLTNICSTQYYGLTLQKGDNLKLAFNNHTDTSEARVQLYDGSGTQLLADSHGTEAQKAAYAKLTSSEGLAAKAAAYVVKLSYADGATKSDQLYDFKVYSGTSYNALYTTVAATESASVAIANGHFAQKYSQADSAVALLSNLANDAEINIMETIAQYV